VPSLIGYYSAFQHFHPNPVKSGNPVEAGFQPNPTRAGFGKMAGFRPEPEPNSGTALTKSASPF